MLEFFKGKKTYIVVAGMVLDVGAYLAGILDAQTAGVVYGFLLSLIPATLRAGIGNTLAKLGKLPQ